MSAIGEETPSVSGVLLAKVFGSPARLFERVFIIVDRYPPQLGW